MDMNMLISITIITVALIICLSMIVLTVLKNKCKHEWETDEKVHVCDHSEIWGNSRYDRYYLRCKKCGQVKIKNMK